MVTGIIIGAAIIVAAIIVSFKGIHIKYDKTFTIDDKRMSTNVPEDLANRLEKLLNQPANTSDEDSHMPSGPMDNVIAEIHDLFGPGSEYKQAQEQKLRR